MKKQFLLVLMLVSTSIFSQANYRTLLEQLDLTTGLVAYYKFDSNSTDFVNGYNGTDSNISYSNAGKIGNSATFGTSISSVIVNDATDLSFTNGSGDLPATINFWFYHRVSPTANGYWYVNKRGTSANSTPTVNEWQIIYSSGLLIFDIYTNNTNYIRAEVSQSISNTTWYMLTATYDGSGVGGLKIYLNGALLTTTNTTTGTYTGTTNTTANLTFGRRGWNSSVGFLDGRMDGVAIWKNRQLTTTEINALFDNGVGKPYPF